MRLTRVMPAAAAVAATIVIVTSPAASAAPASAAIRQPARAVALHWARTQAGKPYIWGGTGPYGYDCSGLVQAAYRHAGVRLPRTTYQLLSDSRQLVRVRYPKPGDIAMYGSGHAELYDKPGWTFGAHDSGSLVSSIRYGPYWHPTEYLALRSGG